MTTLISPGHDARAGSPLSPKSQLKWDKALEGCDAFWGRTTTPLSQASTAPPTPASMGPLPDPFWGSRKMCRLMSTDESGSSCDEEGTAAKLMRRQDYDTPFPVLAFGLPPLQSDLALWASAVVKAEAWLESTVEREAEEESEEDEDDESALPVAFGMPPLQSDLAIWAENVIKAEAWLQDELTRKVALPKCFGMPPLQSDLGIWAERVVQAEEWLHSELTRKALDEDRSSCEAETYWATSSDWSDEEEDSPELPVASFGIPPLQSSLGRWAAAVVKAEEWLETQMAAKAQAEEDEEEQEEEWETL